MNSTFTGDKFRIRVKPRHVRIAYIVDEANPRIEDIFNIIQYNLLFWGGRYNPIIPHKENFFDKIYLDILQIIDPDYVIVLAGNFSEIENTLGTVVNPIKFEDFTKDKVFYTDINNFIYTSNLYNFIFNRTSFFHRKEDCLVMKNSTKTDSLAAFYKINYGITDHKFWHNSVPKHIEKIEFDSTNLDGLDKIIAQQGLILPFELNEVKDTFEKIELAEGADYTSKIVLTDGKNLNDILYFWNSELFKTGTSKRLLIRVNDFEDLVLNDYFLNNLCNYFFRSRDILISSFSISQQSIEHLLEKHQLRKKITDRKIKYSEINSNIKINRGKPSGFKYQIPAREYLVSYSKTLLELNLPETFQIAGDQVWFADIEIERTELSFNPSNLFPLIKIPTNNNLIRIFSNDLGRINKNRELSLLIKNRDFTTNLSIPSPFEIFRTTLEDVNISNKLIHNISLSSDGRLLNGLLDLLSDDLVRLEELVEDKFWFDLLFELSASKKREGDTISFAELIKRCLQEMEKAEFKLETDGPQTVENLNKSLLLYLEELVSKNIFNLGYRIQCGNCLSKPWYHISEVNEKLICRGCRKEIPFKIESEFSYKLNSLVKNNIYIPSDNGNSYHGNLTVIKTLLHFLRKGNKKSFIYSPQVDYYNYDTWGKPIGDIDLLFMDDGRLIIGEAKNDVALFKEDNSKSIKNLILLAEKVKPSMIVLAYMKGPQNKMDSITSHLRSRVSQYNVDVINYRCESPLYNFESHKYFYD